MNYQKLKKIKREYFGYEDIAAVLGISPGSAKVFANRYVKQSFLVRVKRNLYVLRENWDAFTEEEKFGIANLIQVPSYISLMTALGYYDVTTQIQRDFIESVALKRTKTQEVGEAAFTFSKINKKYYFGFSRDKGFFIATPEKAFMDAVYLMSLKRYNFDLTSIDFGKLNMEKIKKMADIFPQKAKRILERNGYFKKA